MNDYSQFKNVSRAMLSQLRALDETEIEDGSITRVVIDVKTKDASEIVSLRLDGDVLNWSCTCGNQRCSHVLTALSWIADDDVSQISQLRLDNNSSRQDPVTSSWPTDRRIVWKTDQADRINSSALSIVLEDIVTAIVRSGTDAGETPSVVEAIQQLIDALPRPIPLGISRWIGRLKEALVNHDIDSVARILDSAARIAEDLSNKRELNQESERRLVSWLGALSHDTKAINQISDHILLEIAREWLDGIERSAIERRYLLDLKTGIVYREERARGMQTASLGPCPRLINVGLAAIEQGVEPQRIRLMQYSVTPVISMQDYYQLNAWASRGFDKLAEQYKNAIATFPGLAEPFAIILPANLNIDSQLLPLDEDESPLPLCCDHSPSAIKFIQANLEKGSLLWIAGRLVDTKGILMLLPLSIGLRSENHMMLRRI